jgi:TolB-like protein/Tfp pilus assembly protein PilF
MSLLSELKRRNVVRVSAAYLALGWVVTEVTGTIVPLLNLPGWLPSVVLWIGIVGFPFVVVFAWVYELTPEGLKRDRAAAGSTSAGHESARRLDYITIAFVAVALLVFMATRLSTGTTPPVVPATGAEAETQLAALDARPAIAVLPFDNLSPDPEQAFFADGLAEDLITRLSSWRAFPVIARNSSFQFRGGNLDVKQVSKALGARYIVEGSVRREGDRIRVTAQLIDASSGEHVWADTYDRKVVDVFDLQDEITAMIAAQLVGDLNRAEAERAHLRGTGNLEAWSLYQLGLQYAGRFTREDFAKAREYFQRAAEQDPRFATALAQRSFVSLWEVALGWDDTPDETIPAMLELSRRATLLDPRDPAAQAALGWAYLMAGDLDNGLDATTRAVQLNPSMPEAWGWLSWALLLAGDMEGCIDAAHRTQRLTPMSGFTSIVYDNLSQAYWQLGRYEEGLQAANRLLAELPDYYLGHVYVAMNAVGLGRLEEARAAISEALRAQPDLSLEMLQATYGVARPEIDARRNAALRQAGLE